MTCVAWNRKVEYIFCSTSNAGLTVVWDLKAKKEVAEPGERSADGLRILTLPQMLLYTTIQDVTSILMT